MKRLKEYLPLYFVVLLILGIIVQFYTQFWQFKMHYGFLLLLFFTLLFLWIKNKIIGGINVLFFFFFVGVFAVFINDARNYTNYYKKHLKENASVTFTIKKVLKSNNYYYKYDVEVSEIDAFKTKGNILLNIEKDSAVNPLNVDDIIYTKALFKDLNTALNPGQFNYKIYLEKQGVYQQVFLENHQFLKLKSGHFSLKGIASDFRNSVQKSLQKHPLEKDELAVVNALLLGQRQYISKELIANYSNAGVIHILAVSGLHVGVILLFLSFFFKPLERMKQGTYLKAILIILLLWCFAFIAGLSASVVRAVTMFSFVAFGLALKRKKIIEFSLFSSLFFLLILKPMFVFEVGFQLSYLAVFSIIWIQPKLHKIWKPEYKVVRFFWNIFTVSIAAQIGVLPLSIYYFQQFPGLFMLSNFVIIPCLLYILIGGILVIISALLNILPQVVADGYGYVIYLMNEFVSWVAHQEAFLFKEISISFLMMFFWYVFIVFGLRLLLHKTTKRLFYFLTSILILQSIFFIESTSKNQQREFIFFHKIKHTIIASRIGENLNVQHDLDPLNYQNDYSLKSYRIEEDITTLHQRNFNNFIQFNKQQILIVDSLGVYQLQGLKNPIVLLQYSPKINLKRLIQKLNPSQVIADGSNYKSYIRRWKQICETNKISFHNTNNKGAFILKY
jgi:competence protein ComEC